jgi:hypothetical protein
MLLLAMGQCRRCDLAHLTAAAVLYTQIQTDIGSSRESESSNNNQVSTFRVLVFIKYSSIQGT